MKFLLLLSLLGVTLAMRDQSIAVKGKLLCGSKPASNVRVKLWEEDGGGYNSVNRLLRVTVHDQLYSVTVCKYI